MDKVLEVGVSVIMPTYNQASFISRAIKSVLFQTVGNWELIIINDGSTDETSEIVKKFLADPRIKYFKNKSNIGLGACLNKGISHSKSNYVAYLPSDDLYHKNHLESMLSILKENKEAILVFSGIRHHYNKMAEGRIEDFPLQLVQVLHKKTEDKWIERYELVTDDLYRMFWAKLEAKGCFLATSQISSEWVDHPDQRHKIIQEPIGGLQPYKLKYKVNRPLRFHSTTGNFIDEVEFFKPFRKPAKTKEGGLKILLVGELAYNSERIYALEEYGHQLYGLWTDSPYWFNTVGPLPFGNVKDIQYENWIEQVKKIKPNVIYALLNWQTVLFAYKILNENPGIPFVWHFKEGPFICQEKGVWKELISLFTKSDGQIYTSPEMKVWFEAFLPEKSSYTMILDGDLPKKEWFTEDVSPLLSEKDGEIHTVVPGRPIGLHPQNVAELAEEKVHLHFYGDFTHGQWKEWINKTDKLAKGYLHTHSNCTQNNWVKEFSQYDAGWLHFFKSENYGELMKANWDDLNYPARIATLAVAGLPMLQRDNSGHIVATQTLAKELEIGLFFKTFKELGNLLRDQTKMRRLRNNIWGKRNFFCFDEHVQELTEFFLKVIEKKKMSIETAMITTHAEVVI